jgi:hypothetical protein
VSFANAGRRCSVSGWGLDDDTEGDRELASPVERPIRFRHTIHA